MLPVTTLGITEPSTTRRSCGWGGAGGGGGGGRGARGRGDGKKEEEKHIIIGGTVVAQNS